MKSCHEISMVSAKVGASDAIAAFAKLVSDNLDKSRKPLAVSLDLAKAFNTVFHRKLKKNSSR